MKHSRLKIAVWHNLPSGGGKRALHDHVRGLTQRGHTVEAWCPPSADSSYLPLSNLIPEHVVPVRTSTGPEWRGLRVISAKRKLLAAMEDHCRRCAAEISARGFDVLLANPCIYFRTSAIAKYVTIPRVLYLQEPHRALYEALPNLVWAAIPPITPAESRVTFAKRFIRNMLAVQAIRIQVREERSYAAAFDAILVNSLYSRESILRTYGLEANVCYLGIDTQRFCPTGEARENYVIGLGGLDVIKGVDRAIRAIAHVPLEIRPQLLWIGNYSDLNEERQARELARTLDVQFEVKVGVCDLELVSLLSRAVAMLYTSRLEPFGYAPLEANACGTPVVAIAEGGVRETIVDGVNGLVVNCDNPRLLGHAVETLVRDKTLAETLGRNAIDYVRKEWSLESAVDRLEADLQRVTANRAPGRLCNRVDLSLGK